MPIPVLRPMLPADVDAAIEMILANGWGVRRAWLEFAATQPACVPLVAEADGRIVATGVGTTNGPVGWIGTIFVEPGWRGQGLGRATTQAILERLDAAGCRTIVLVATTEGRRLYEKMGFEVQTRYRVLEAPGLPAAAAASGADRPGPGGIRPFVATDLEPMAALDLAATGEDRAHALQRLATPDSAMVLVTGDSDLAVGGFVIRAPWGGGATVAPSIDAALRIVEARRMAAGPEGRVRTGILAENKAGLATLRRAGFRAQWSAPRMVRGEPMEWHPEWIWGQFNHAMG
jgi:GNAT superfamily N-acetyltransferase